ncbi:MAG TPA: peptide chain release factor-like protein [Phycisphaerales bacterium]|nr:peptide chain release factor-like protein [Phycisphaerales bacterium]
MTTLRLGSVYVDPPHPATLEDEVLLKACRFHRGHSPGPGGQHRNRVQTLVEIHHVPTGLKAHAGERRSAEQNKRKAVFRLRLVLAVWIRSPVSVGEIRSELWKSRVKDGRIACNEAHRDYPAMLAEALDVIVDAGLDAHKASVRLRCSQSQLIKLLAKHPPALAALNSAREAKKLHPFRA